MEHLDKVNDVSNQLSKQKINSKPVKPAAKGQALNEGSTDESPKKEVVAITEGELNAAIEAWKSKSKTVPKPVVNPV